ncbi:MAG TPA: hypothetical protein VIL46_09145 [Gemmataceae bacterium]
MNDRLSLEKSPPEERHPPAVPPDVESLDWDVSLDTPPARPKGTVRVELRYQGRGKPIPVDDPAAE